MGIIKRTIGRLLFPAIAKFADDLSSAFMQSIEEIQTFDEDVKSVCTTWLAVCPHTYFNELFLEAENWNRPIVNIFHKSGMLDAPSCFRITQGYYLRHLKQVISQDPNYKNVPIRKIEAEIRNKMTYGKEIIGLAVEFKKELKKIASIEDFTLCYIDKVMSIPYTDKDERDSCRFEIWQDSVRMLALATFTNESIRKAKEVDSQFNGAKQ
jgi:hypothetical protein